MLKEKIHQNLNTAIKEKKELELLVLRQLLSSIFNKEKEKRYKLAKEKPELKTEELEKESSLTDEEITEVISSEIKKRREAIELYQKGQRPELAEKEEKEAEILKLYLPEQLPEEELRKLIKEAVVKVGAKTIKDMGKVMAELMPKIKGKAESGLVSKIVKETLGL